MGSDGEVTEGRNDSMSAHASVRIQTTEPDVEFITKALGLQPTHSRLKGQLRSSRLPNGPTWADSLWIFRAPVAEAEDLERHIECILDILEDRCQALHTLRSRGVGMDVHCSFMCDFGQGSMNLSAALIKRLSEQDIDVSINLYPPLGEKFEIGI